MRCEIVPYAGKDQSTFPIFRCTTHDWTILHAIEPGYACPIGRIEQARDDALLAIRDAYVRGG